MAFGDYVNGATPIVGASGTSVAFGATSLTAGNILIVMPRWGGAAITITSITDTAGNTFAQAGTTQDIGANDHLGIWYVENATGHATNVVTINFSSTGTNALYAVTAQYVGSAGTSLLDTTAKGSATGTSATSGAFTTAQAAELIVTGVGVASGNGTTLTQPGGYTKRAMSITGGADIAGVADLVVASIQSGATLTWTDSSSDTIGVVVATFKDPAGGGAATVAASTLTLMGVQ